MNKSKIGLIIMALIVAWAVGAWGCGGTSLSQTQKEAAATAAKLQNALGNGAEGISATDFNSPVNSNNFEYDTVGSAVKKTGVSVSAVSIPDPKLWWLLMDPLRRAHRDEAREVLEAPSHLAFYLATTSDSLPACINLAKTGTCPLNLTTLDSCTVDITFGNTCDLTINEFTLRLSGELTRHSVVTDTAGIWNIYTTANNFKATKTATGSFLTWNGLLTKNTDGKNPGTGYDWHYNWLSDGLNPVTITNTAGDILTTNGTHDLWVKDGDSVDDQIDTYPAVKLAGGGIYTLHRVVRKTAKVMGGNTVDLSVGGTVENLTTLKTWTRTGSYTLERGDTAPITTSVLVNGTGSVVGPDGKTFNVSLTNVVYDIAFWVPVSGSAKATFADGSFYTIHFTGSCTLTWQDDKGKIGTFNYCQWDSYSN